MTVVNPNKHTKGNFKNSKVLYNIIIGVEESNNNLFNNI